MHASMPCRAVMALATASVVTLLCAAPGSAQPVNPSPQLYVGDNRPQPVIFREGRLYATGNDTITFPNAAYAIAGAPQGLFFSTNSGLGIFNTHMLPLNRADLAVGDLRDAGPYNASNTTYVSGLGAGFNFAPINVAGTPVVFGLYCEFDFVNASSTTIVGSQTIGLPNSVNSATTTFKDNHFWTGGVTATVPFFPSTFQNMAITGGAGFAEITKTVTFNCNNWCTTAGVPTFAESQRINIPGWYASVQIQQQTSFFNLPVMMYVRYEHVQGISGQTVSFGTPQTVFASNNITQGINIFSLGTQIPLSTVVTVVSSVIPGNLAR